MNRLLRWIVPNRIAPNWGGVDVTRMSWTTRWIFERMVSDRINPLLAKATLDGAPIEARLAIARRIK